jgi:hypothetical protein
MILSSVRSVESKDMHWKTAGTAINLQKEIVNEIKAADRLVDEEVVIEVVNNIRIT